MVGIGIEGTPGMATPGMGMDLKQTPGIPTVPGVKPREEETMIARSALYVETGKTKPWKSCSSLLRKVITFCEEDLRVGTGPVRLGSLTHDSEAAPKVTPL